MMLVNKSSVLAAGILFIFLGVLAVFARFSVRISRKQRIGIDDWLCLPALVRLIGPFWQRVPHTNFLHVSVIGCCVCMIIGRYLTHSLPRRNV